MPSPFTLDQLTRFWPAALVAVVIVALLLRSIMRGPVPVDQVAAVNDQAVSWQRKRVLNHNEGLVYACACAVVKQINPGWQVWPQVSLGEVLRTEGRSEAGRQAFRGINSKRADFLVADAAGWPMAVIEYQGMGHHRGNSAERDMVKRIVLPRAGICYGEVPAELSKGRLHFEAHLARELNAALTSA